MIFIAISKKVTITGNNIDVVTTTYDNEFINIRNNKGRKKIGNYYILSDSYFKQLKQNKIKALKKQAKTRLKTLSNLNSFKYFLTIHVNSKSDYEKFTNRLKKSDKELKFISLASWNIKSNLHYHFMIDTKLSENKLMKECKDLNYDLQLIPNSRNQNKIRKYFAKNYADTISVLHSDDIDLKDKQIEILQYNKILSNSTNLKKPIVKKFENISEVEELEGAEHCLTLEYNNKNSKVQIDKYIK